MLEFLFNKVVVQKVWHLIKKRLQHRCFLVKFAKLPRTPFFHKTPPVTASVILMTLYSALRNLLSLRLMGVETLESVSQNFRCRFYFLFLVSVAMDKLTGNLLVSLKVQSCKLYNNKYMIASTQITNTEISHS